MREKVQPDTPAAEWRDNDRTSGSKSSSWVERAGGELIGGWIGTSRWLPNGKSSETTAGRDPAAESTVSPFAIEVRRREAPPKFPRLTKLHTRLQAGARDGAEEGEDGGEEGEGWKPDWEGKTTESRS